MRCSAEQKSTSIALWLIVALLFLSPSIALAESAFADWPKKPAKYVTDKAGMIAQKHEHALNGYLQELEQKTGAQFVVVTVESLQGLTKEQFALSLAEHWKLGQKGKDNGLIFLVAKKERKYRFETGYGLEGVLPDGYLGQVGRERLVPLMKQGKSSEAIAASAITVVQKIADNAGAKITGMPELNRLKARRAGKGDWISLLVMMLFFGGFIFNLIRRARAVRSWGGGRYRRSAGFFPIFFGGGGFSSGSRSSGGFGSFGGGMGGGFGGGGAGGGW